MALLEIDQLKKDYPHPAGAVAVLKGANAAVEKGSTVAIVGQSGSGKSTLLSLLAGLDRPSSGAVRLLDQDIGQMNEAALAKFRAQHIGIVFQQFHLMSHLSAIENVALPLQITGDSDVESKAEQALKDVGLGHRLRHFPAELSGGECQRVAIARAVVAAADVILADEPSGNLDAKTGDQVMGQLFEVAKSRSTTLILVTHNQDLADKCERQLTLTEGLLTDTSKASGTV